MWAEETPPIAKLPIQLPVINSRPSLGGPPVVEAQKSRLIQFFTSTTGWTIIVCLLGIAATFQPFSPLAQVESLQPERLGQPIPPNPWFESTQVFGYESPLTIAVGTMFLALFLLLIATSFIQPIPLWRSVLILLAGIVVMSVMGLAVQSKSSGLRQHQYTQIQSFLDAWPGIIWPIVARIKFPVYVITGLGCGLVLLGTIQLRGVLMRRLPKPTDKEQASQTSE